MERILENGHLSDALLMALASGGPLPEQERLEAAEHLAFCNECLLRYTMLLPEDTLLMPQTSCQLGLWRQIRRRTLRMMTSRAATAVAAMAIVFSLWGFGIFGGMVNAAEYFAQERQSSMTEELCHAPQDWAGAASGFFDRLGQTLNDTFDGGRSRGTNKPIGGNYYAT